MSQNNYCVAFRNINNEDKIIFELIITIDEINSADDHLSNLSNFKYAPIIKYLGLDNSNELKTLICETTDFFIDADFEELSYDEDEYERTFVGDFEKKNQSIQINDRVYTGGVLIVEVLVADLERSLKFSFKNFDSFDIDKFDPNDPSDKKSDIFLFSKDDFFFL
jgi:hypothetical protein